MKEQPAAIAGVFADYRLVKTRSTLQIVVEIPVERQAEAFEALGYPVPGTDIHVAVARLNPRAGAEPAHALGNPPESANASAAADEQRGMAGRTVGSIPATGAIQRHRYQTASPAEQAVTRAALLSQDQRFQAWVSTRWQAVGVDIATEEEAADFIRTRCCDGNSRRLIADVPEYRDRFMAIETEFKIAVGELAGPR